MTELKVGDHVVVDTDTPHSQWYQCEGIVRESRESRESRAHPNSGKVELTKLGPNAKYLKVGDTTTLFNLELINPAFTFADIQINDRIRRTLTRDTGTTEVREGVVTEKSALYATDTNPGKTAAINYILAYVSDGDPAKPQVVLELLDRPEKELELWEDRKPGDKIVTYLSDGLDRIFTKREDGLWDTLVYTSGKKLGKGFPRADQDIAAYLTKQTVTAEIVK